MAHYYLSRWEWATEGSMSFWRAPQNALGCLDLRSLPQMSKTGGIPEGYGFFVYPTQVAGLDYYLGDDTTLLSLAKKLAVKNLLDIPGNITASKLLDILWELLVSKADPTGLTRWKPLMPGIDGKLKLYLGGHSLVKEETYNPVQHLLVLELLRHDYRRLRGEFQAIGSEHYRKVLSAWEAKYSKFGLAWQDFIPAGLPQETPLPHSTVITESFNKADSDILGPDLTWTELLQDIDVVSNRAENATIASDALARADTDLASDDHYVQSLVYSDATGDQIISVHVRKDSTITLTYYLYLERFAFGTLGWYIYKRINGAHTEIGSLAGTPTSGATLRGESDASSHTLKENNVIKVGPITDTAITGNLRTGIGQGFQKDYTTKQAWDNFEAGDLVVFVPRIIMF